jgi:hypothetical protein
MTLSFLSPFEGDKEFNIVKIRYFAIDSDGHVRKASQAAVHGIWERKRPISSFSKLRVIYRLMTVARC